LTDQKKTKRTIIPTSGGTILTSDAVRGQLKKKQVKKLQREIVSHEKSLKKLEAEALLKQRQLEKLMESPTSSSFTSNKHPHQNSSSNQLLLLPSPNQTSHNDPSSNQPLHQEFPSSNQPPIPTNQILLSYREYDIENVVVFKYPHLEPTYAVGKIQSVNPLQVYKFTVLPRTGKKPKFIFLSREPISIPPRSIISVIELNKDGTLPRNKYSNYHFV